jgi:dienelactone hydrolase
VGALPCFLGPERHLFAWHHVARAQVRRGAAVVLCPPLGFDYICVYRSWRILAEELAGLGFDVLRFDYHSTGDSAGDPEEPGRLDAWLASIERAMAEARAITGTRHVALVGLRLGATLAVEVAAARGGVSRLVLWSPFRSGRAFVRELTAVARLCPEPDVQEPDGEDDMQAAGHIVTRQTLNAIERLDLNALSGCPAPEVLIVDRDDRPHDASLGARLEQLGSRVTRCRPEGTAAALIQPALSRVPRPVIEAITGWLHDWRPPGPSLVPRRESASVASRMACGAGYRERAIHFGPGGRLFGILTEPMRPNPDAPALIIFTTGSEYHVGPNRLYVPLSRLWAAEGHVVLRYDLGGIGDSLAPPGIGDNVAYPAHALDDARAAIALVRSHALAPRRVMVLGLCSGGWLAFRAALGGLPVDAIVAINPPLYLRDGEAGMQDATDDSEFARYRRLMFDRPRWTKALRGRAAYGTFLRLGLGVLGRTFLTGVNTVCGGRLIGGFNRELDAISARGITCLFVFSRGDRSLKYFRLYGGGGRRGQRRGIHHVVVDGAGHTFRPLAAQRELRALLIDFVASCSKSRLVAL